MMFIAELTSDPLSRETPSDSRPSWTGLESFGNMALSPPFQRVTIDWIRGLMGVTASQIVRISSLTNRSASGSVMSAMGPSGCGSLIGPERPAERGEGGSAGRHRGMEFGQGPEL